VQVTLRAPASNAIHHSGIAVHLGPVRPDPHARRADRIDRDGRDTYVNALAETTIGLHKAECVRDGSPFRDGPLRTLADVENITIQWVHWYNAEPRPSTGPIFRSQTPAMIEAEHAAWICATALVRALARTAARHVAPASKGPLAGRPVRPRQISFTAARRAVLATTRSGAASLPALMKQAFHRGTLLALGKQRIVIDRHRHR
jgi:hypothetical protein